jgi:hypothetical protein
MNDYVLLKIETNRKINREQNAGKIFDFFLVNVLNSLFSSEKMHHSESVQRTEFLY